MHIERKDIDTLNAELHIHVAPADYTERVDNAIKKYRKTMQMPGFRPGHVPMSLVKQRYGKSILAEEINQVIQSNLYKYLSENKIEVLGSPIPGGEQNDVGDWDNPGDFKFTYQLGLAPAIHIDLDATHKFDYFKVKVDDELINRQVKDLARRYGKMSDPETSAAEDMLMVELNELGEDGMLKEGGISNKTTVSIEFVKDADTKASLIGLTVGSIVEIDPHHLTENHEDLAKMLGVTHHDVHHLASKFQAKVNEIKRIEPHAVDQELFDKLYGPGEVNAEQEMRNKVKADLEQMFARDSDFLFKREFAKKITEMIDPVLPDAFLKRYIQLTNEKPVTEEMVEHDYPFYAAQLRWELIEGKIIRQYELRVSPEDALEHVKQVLASRYAQYGLPMEDEMLTDFAKKTLAKKEEAKNVYDFLYEEKIIALVKEKCTLNEHFMPYGEFIGKVQHS
jgi:trigger factor